MAFNGFGADSFFSDEFHGGAEKVVEESPFLGIEVIPEVALWPEEGDDSWVV